MTKEQSDALWQAIKDSAVAIEAVVWLTERLDEHPETWDGPCLCADCIGYGDIEVKP